MMAVDRFLALNSDKRVLKLSIARMVKEGLCLAGNGSFEEPSDNRESLLEQWRNALRTYVSISTPLLFDGIYK